MEENGIMNTQEMIDSLIVDCGEIVKRLVSGNYVGFCLMPVNMVQKLNALKKGVEDELSSKDEIIRELRKINNDLTEKVTGIKADRENERSGS